MLLEKSLSISMIGRINLIKMIILPKFIYLFQSLPFPLSKAFFKEINSMFCRFIWNNRKPRLRLKLLYLPYDRGGLQLPNLQCYYWAAQLRSAMFYFSAKSTPAWVSIEQVASELPLKLYIYTPQILKPLKDKHLTHFLKTQLIYGSKLTSILKTHRRSLSFP